MAVIEMEVSEEFAARWRTMPEAERHALTQQLSLANSQDEIKHEADQAIAWQRFLELAHRAPASGRKFNREELYEED